MAIWFDQFCHLTLNQQEQSSDEMYFVGIGFGMHNTESRI
jgi:hypothetical protein